MFLPFYDNSTLVYSVEDGKRERAGAAQTRIDSAVREKWIGRAKKWKLGKTIPVVKVMQKLSSGLVYRNEAWLQAHSSRPIVEQVVYKEAYSIGHIAVNTKK